MNATFIRARLLSEDEADLVWKATAFETPLTVTGRMAEAANGLSQKGYGIVSAHPKRGFFFFRLNAAGEEIAPKLH